MNFSLKYKTLSILLSLSLMGLATFGYFTFETYKEDKLAFVYDSLLSETIAKTTLFTSVSDSYDLMLGSIIARVDASSKVSLRNIKSFLAGKQKRIQGLFLHIPTAGLAEETVYLTEGLNKDQWGWQKLKAAPIGISLVDSREGIFLLKKGVEGSDAFVAVSFRQLELWSVLKSKDGNHNFILNKGKIVSRSADPAMVTAIEGFSSRILDNPGTDGLFEETVLGDGYFVSYAKFGSSDLVLVSLIEAKKVLLVKDILLQQMFGFLALTGFVCLLIGTIAAKWLTHHLDDLTHAAEEFGNENFDVQVDIKSNDELGVLGASFNSMASKIKGLLEELRLYNLELEEKVRERTKELQALTDIQKGMVNALGQGFVLVDRENKILPIYSKVATDMFEVVPDQAKPGDIMALGETEAESFKELFELMFNQQLSFDDMAQMAPDHRSNSKNQHLKLSYAPIMNSGDEACEYVLIIGTDKTAEVETLEKFNKEWQFSQMVMRMASNRSALNRVLRESFTMLSDCHQILDAKEQYPLRTIQRLVHTIKGSFSYFHIPEITALCHDFETFLTPYYDAQSFDAELRHTITERITTIQISLECFVDHYDNIIQYKQSEHYRSLKLDDLRDFSRMLKKTNPELQELFTKTFFRSKVATSFQLYPAIVDGLGKKLGKDVKFTIKGGDLELPEGPWDEVFQQSIHFIRNSVDHGLETREERQNNGKNPMGEICFSFERIQGKAGEALRFILEDDGKGVDWEKLAQKDPSVTDLASALERIKTGGVSSKDEVSDISGRGVGVSSLFAAVEKVGGQADFISEKGVGIKIIVTLPLSAEKKQDLGLAA